MDVVTGLIPNLNAAFKELDAFLDNVLAQHKAAKRNEDDDHHKSEKKGFVDILHQLQQDGLLEFQLSHSDLKALLLDLFIGGSDATSTALEWAFTELMRNPKVMKKAQEEVRRVMGNKSKVEEDDETNDVLGMCCQRNLRLHPPVPLLVPRVTRSSVTLGGYYIPPKTTVYVNARDPEFWLRPEEFEAERFKNNMADVKGQGFELIPFGSGRKGCPGISFGFASLEYVLANLLYWFDWKLHGENGKSAQQEDIDVNEKRALTAVKRLQIYVQPVPSLQKNRKLETEISDGINSVAIPSLNSVSNPSLIPSLKF